MIKEIKKTQQQVKERWPELEINTITYKILRKTSAYNKNIKWYAETFRTDGTLLSSFGYRTGREARQSIKAPFEPFWIGNRPTWTIYQEV